MDTIERLNLIRDKLDIVTAFLDGVHSMGTYSEGSTQHKMYLDLHRARGIIDVWIREETRDAENEADKVRG